MSKRKDKMSNGDELMQRVIDIKTAAGLKLTWFIPELKRNFTAYPRNEAQKQKWLRDAVSRGWELQ